MMESLINALIVDMLSEKWKIWEPPEHGAALHRDHGTERGGDAAHVAQTRHRHEQPGPGGVYQKVKIWNAHAVNLMIF